MNINIVPPKKKFYNSNKFYIDYRKLFPLIKNTNVLPQNLYIDKESLSYITILSNTYEIKNILSEYISKLEIDNNLCIVDAMGGVGGDTISFCKTYEKVISIENNEKRFIILKNNVSAYKFNNVELINNDCLEIIPTLHNIDILYVDPPWGGKDYKLEDKINITLNNNIKLEDFILNCFDKNKMLSIPKLIVLKLPLNYDCDLLDIYFNNIYYHKLNKFLLVVISFDKII
jgi:16S rRNA G966 N2-methylase RsmD